VTSAAYFRDWRAAHPAYRTRQNALRSERRRKLGRSDRTMEYAKRPSRAIDVSPMPFLHQGHPLFDQARAVVGPERTALTVLADPLYDDLISVATLAILQGRDAREDVRRFRATEMSWRRITCEIVLGMAA